MKWINFLKITATTTHPQEVDNLNSLITIKGVKFIILNLPKKNLQA